ncbi:MAG: pilus assembly PilX N-terminal domain-containing protein [Phycisphaerales bacterium]
MSKTHTYTNRRGSVLAVLVVILAVLGLVVAGSVRPVKDEATLAGMRVETMRAFYAAESGTIVLVSAYMGDAVMPLEGSEVVLNGQSIVFTQIPEQGGAAIVHGKSGDATRRIELVID